MKFEEIIKDVRKGKPFTSDGYIYRWNSKKRVFQYWVTDLMYPKKFWADDDVMFCEAYEVVFSKTWRICEKEELEK